MVFEGLNGEYKLHTYSKQRLMITYVFMHKAYNLKIYHRQKS